MLVLALVGAITVSAVAVTARELLRVGRLEPRGANDLIAALASRDRRTLQALIETVFPDGDAALIEGAVEEGSSRAAAAAAAHVNAELGAVDRELSSGKDIPRVALRVSLFSGTAGAVTELASGVGRGADHAWVTSLLAFATGAAGAAVCFELGRRSLASAGARRAEWDRIGAAFVRRLAPSLESGAPGTAPPQDPMPSAGPKRARRRAS